MIFLIGFQIRFRHKRILNIQIPLSIANLFAWQSDNPLCDIFMSLFPKTDDFASL